MPRVTPQLLNNFTEVFLKPRYDDPKPIPDLHREMWEMCCSSHQYVAIAAPREHAKSTAITHAFTLASVLFQDHDHVLIVSDTEGQAADFLGDIKKELQENEDLIATFQVKKFIKDTEREIIVQTGYGEFRIIAKGSEQKVRGIKWRNKRPNLIVVDDAENDESVENAERREKFRKWFMKALLPCGSKNKKVRVVGTILHLDSMLNRILSNKTWKTKKFAAHNKDFSKILWPEQFPEERLRQIRDNFMEEGDLDGYNQEYLNNPVAEGNTYFRKQDFIEMDKPDYESEKVYFAAADFAISEKEKADYTVMMVAGVDSKGVIHIVDVRRGRMDSMEIIEELFSIQSRYNPEIFTFETEKIDKAIGPFLRQEMISRGIFINIETKTPTKSKTTRGRSIQAKMKAGGIRFNKKADWYPDLESELMTITPAGPKGKHDDFFDAFAYIGLTIDDFRGGRTPEEQDEDDYNREFSIQYVGASSVTGY